MAAYERAARVPRARACVVCGGLAPTGPTCFAPACLASERRRRAGVAEARELALQGRRNTHAATAELEARERIAARVPRDVRNATLPFFPAALVPTQSLSRKRLRAHLTPLAEAAVGHRGAAPAAREGDAGASPILATVCGACRGQCCSHGGHTAYLGEAELRKLREARPAATAAELADDYVGRVPGEHFAGSCVFHGASGCALPREMRASVCNTFVCSSARELETLALREKGPPILAALVAGDRVEGAVLIDEGRAVPLWPDPT